MSVRSTEISELVLRREAEVVRWFLTGEEGGLDDSRWLTAYDPVEDYLFLRHKLDARYVRIPGAALKLSLDAVSERYIQPFVRELPSVLASARAKGDAEYASWGQS